MTGRAVPEWVATHPDQAIPPRVKLRVWERCRGRCAISGKKLRPGDPYDFDHVIALANGGEHRESNLQVLSRDKHKAKTAEDVALKSKTTRQREKHLGIWPKPVRKLQGRGFEPSRQFAARKP